MIATLARFPLLLALLLGPLAAQAQFNPRIYGSAPQQSANNGGSLSLAAGEWLSLSTYDYPAGSHVEWLHNLTPIPDEHDPWVHFDEVTTADAGIYAARVTINGQPFITPSITISVLPGLAILQNPPNPVVAGDSVTLTATAPGAGELRDFVWRHRGVIIPNATSPTLVIASANIASGGPYAVAATYTALGRTVRGPRHRVDVYPALSQPIIVTQPRPLTIAPNGPGLFAVGASGTGPFSYRWQKDGVDLEDEHEFFVGGDQIPPEAAGSYRVIVSNNAGSVTSAPVTLTISAPPAPNPQATALVATGRNHLTNHTSAALSSAASTFASAVNLDPNHPLANLFYSLTRLVDVINQSPAQQFMNRLQIEASQRDVYDWTARVAEKPDGSPLPPPGVNAAEFPAFARDHFLPQLQGARANLARLTDAGFTADLTAAETTLDHVTVDQADLHVARAGLALLEFWVRTLNSWNLSAPLTHLDDLATQDLLSIQRLLADYPALLAYADAAQVAPARAALEEAVDDYVYAAALLRTRDPDDVRLFSLEPEDLAEEAAFRQFVLDLKASLSAPATLNGTAAEAPGIDDATQYQVQLGPLLDGTHSVRSLLPSFLENDADPATLPDASFGNAIVSIGPPSILLPPIDRNFSAGSAVSLGVVALGAEPLHFQWYKNGTLLPNATSDTLTIPNAQAGDEALYEVHVQNLLGETWSDGAWLELNRPPHIIVQPQSQTAFVGTRVLLTVTVAGTFPMTFEWQRNGLPILHATDPTLLLPRVLTSEAGDYRCVIRNVVGEVTSQTVTLTVLEGGFAPVSVAGARLELTYPPPEPSIAQLALGPATFSVHTDTGDNLSGAYTYNRLSSDQGLLVASILSPPEDAGLATDIYLIFTSPNAGQFTQIFYFPDGGSASEQGSFTFDPTTPADLILTTTGLDGNAGFVLNLQGPAGGTWIVQWSDNLQTWNDLQPFPNFPGSASVIDHVPAGRTARFYRALQR